MERCLRSLAWGGALVGLVCLVTYRGPTAEAQIWNQRVRQRPNRAKVLPNGQIVAGAAQEDDEEGQIEGVFLAPDRTAKRRLEQAQEMLGTERFGEAVRYLGSLLEGSEDYFFKPDANTTVFRSLKAEAGRLIAGMPAAGRESYELQFGARARRMLDEASASGDAGQLAEIARRFFYTKAGAEASFLLSRQHLDHGRPLAAALSLQRLRDTPAMGDRFEPMLSLYLAAAWSRAAMPDKAQEALVKLKHERAGEVRIAGEMVKLFGNDAQALAWLQDKVGLGIHSQAASSDEWVVYRGDAERNASSSGGRPLLNPRWRVRVAHLPQIADLVGQLRQAYIEQDIAALPSLHPLAVGNVVLMRDTRSLLAVDFTTGKLIWEAEPLDDASLDQVLAGGTGGAAAPQQFGQTPQLVGVLDERLWDDPIYGTLSSDGEQVFMIENLTAAAGAGNRPTVIQARGQRRLGGILPKTYNRMTARELKTEGKLKWEVGDFSGGDEPKLAGAFFLGPPLPLQGRLYVLAEMKGQEIRLLALSAKTGKLDWSQQLSVVEQNIQFDPDRRAGGAMPSFADGVLICPTSAGAVVAVDLTTRSLLWGYQYPRSQQTNINRINALRIGGAYPMNERRAGDRWVDATATISGGRVLLTPVESDQIYCLNLIDGKVEWKLDRGNNLYVACVDDGHVILVGHHQVSAWNLSDGKQAWQQPLELAAGAIPSGRGFHTDHSYFLPLSTAEVVQLDLRQGTVTSRAKSRRGKVPGNLICHQGEVLSQSVDFVDTFYQLDVLKQHVHQTLETAADDPKALARLGEIKLDEGKLAEAIDLFRRSFELDHDDYTRDLLVDSLMEGLRSDFAISRAQAEELEQLIDQKHQRATYLRLVAVGLHKSGETLPALAAYLKLASEQSSAEKQAGATDLEEMNDTLSVRRERWLDAQLNDLRAHATDADRVAIDAAVGARLTAAATAHGPTALREFLKIFSQHPLADEAREKLVSLVAGSGSLLERELLLRRLEQSSDPARAGHACARLAELFDEARRPELAAIYYRRLSDRFADVACLDGKTGKQLVAQLAATSPVAKLMAGVKAWPIGKVEVEERGARALSPAHHQRAFDLPIHGFTGPVFEQMTVTLEPQTQAIVGLDGLGGERFRIVLSEANTRRTGGFNGPYGFNNPAINYVSVNGNLLLLWMGHQLVAIDTLRSGENGSRVLWTQELNEQVPGVQVQQGFHHRPLNVAWGMPRFVPQDSYGRLIGNMGPVNFGGVCVQRFRELICVDPLTGEVLWTRKNVPVGSDTFGDEELLIVAPPEGGEALVLRALDGELLGKRQVPPLEQRMTTLGRFVLSWENKDSKQVVTLRDPWRDEDKWSQTFAAGSKGAVLENDAVGVLQPNGEFKLIRLADGQALVEEKLAAESSLSGLHLLRSADQYLVLTNSPPTNVEANVNIQPAPGGQNNPLVSGWLYAFDRANGKQLWPAPISIQQHGLTTTQPSELPILAFVRHMHRANPAGQHQTQASVLCVDKRTGRVAFKKDDLQLVVNNFELVGDRNESAVSLLLPGKTITMTLTDKPLPPVEQPEPPRKKSALEGLGDSIMKALDKTRRKLEVHPPADDLFQQ